MSSRIPKYTENKSQAIWKTKTFLIATSVLIGVLIGSYSSNIYVKQSMTSLQKQNDSLDKKNREMYSENEQYKTQLSLLNTEVKVKKEATMLLQKQYQSLLKQKNELKSENNFFQKLLDPKNAAQGLRVLKANFHDNNTINLTLAQKIQRVQEISGKVKIKIEGTKSEETTINPENNTANFKFKYFQNISFQFSLPEGFQAKNLIVELIPSNNKRKSITQTFSWESLNNNED